MSEGIFFRSERALELAGMADVAVLCSRGTVLVGEPEVVSVETFGGASQGRLAALAEASEKARGTAAGKALFATRRAYGSEEEALRSVALYDGLGTTSLLSSGDALCVGTRALMLRERISVASHEERIRDLEAQGASVMLVAIAGKLAGLVALSDTLRPGARSAIHRMIEARVEPVLMSAEAREACETLAKTLEIEHIRPEVLPQDRASEVRALADGGHVVACVGRATDEAALAAADVSIVLGPSAESSFSVHVASDDLRAASGALHLAKGLRERFRVALIAAFVPTLVTVLGLGLGLLPLYIGPLAGLSGVCLALLLSRREG